MQRVTVCASHSEAKTEMRSLLSLFSLLLILIPSCESAPSSVKEARKGEQIVVELVDANFVRYQGERIPMEDFFYEIRVRCRDAISQSKPVPWIEVHTPSDGTVVPGAVFQRLQKGMWEAGVQLIDPKL
ncbi:MAG: hypothetical protein ACYTG5_20635 [Planctomycetota bacterium]|jgi:hypothetical protein